MINTLFENIQQHLSMLDLAVLSSKKITTSARLNDLDAVISETENRERIVNIVTVIQRKVEEQINIIETTDFNQDSLMILKSWFQDLSILSEKMLNYDKETVDLLAQQKDETGKEISMIFKNKEIFKGYNHIGKK
jgi:hypothetical protein